MELLPGQKYGRLTIIKKSVSKIGYYECICKCGNKKEIDGKSLLYNRTLSCGCLQKEQVGKAAKEIRGINEQELIGKIFTRWTVIKVNKKDKYGQWHYQCKCICGKEKDISRVSLISGKSQSCGCLNSERTTKRLLERYSKDESWKELIGQKFERLTVVRRTEEKIDNRYYYVCKCDCGNEITVAKSNLTSGRSKSCGCLNSEVMKERFINYRIDKGLDPDLFMDNAISSIRKFIFDPMKSIILDIDNNTCCLCLHQCNNLQVHHIDPIFNFLDIKSKTTYNKLYDIKNLVSLCPDCHSLAHGNNTKDINLEIQKELQAISKMRPINSKIKKSYDFIVKKTIIPAIVNLKIEQLKLV